MLICTQCKEKIVVETKGLSQRALKYLEEHVICQPCFTKPEPQTVIDIIRDFTKPFQAAQRFVTPSTIDLPSDGSVILGPTHLAEIAMAKAVGDKECLVIRGRGIEKLTDWTTRDFESMMRVLEGTEIMCVLDGQYFASRSTVVWNTLAVMIDHRPPVIHWHSAWPAKRMKAEGEIECVKRIALLTNKKKVIQL